MYNKAERGQIAGIISAAIKKSIFAERITPFTYVDIHPDNTQPMIHLAVDKDHINELFESLSKDHRDESFAFYTFKKIDVAESIINSKKIQLTSLSSLSAIDCFEYIELMKRIDVYSDERKDIFYGYQNELFVLCFTSTPRNKKYWEERDTDKLNEIPVCLSFRFTFKEKIELVQFCDIYYDDGYDFDFINEINFYLFRSFSKRLNLGGIHFFSKFYKRNKFAWEEETRLCINNEMEKVDPQFKDGSLYQIKNDPLSTRAYAEMNFSNSVFTCEVDEIIIQLKHKHSNEIKTLLSSAKKKKIRVSYIDT